MPKEKYLYDPEYVPEDESESWRSARELANSYFQKKFALPEEERQQGMDELRDLHRFGEFPEDAPVEQELRSVKKRPQFNTLKQKRIDALPGLEQEEADDISLQPSIIQRIAGPIERAYKSAVGQPDLPANKNKDRKREPLQQDQENAFQSWYGKWARKMGLDPNPDSPMHQYDYRAAFKAGAEPGYDPESGELHWPSEFKDADHPTRIKNGIDTATGKRVTQEGRQILNNPDGTISTEETITIADPLNKGKYVNIPTIYGGKRVSDDEATEIYKKNRGVDQDTGLPFEAHETIDQAEKAAQARSNQLGQLYGQDPGIPVPTDLTITGQKIVEPSMQDKLLGLLPFGGHLQSPQEQAENAALAELSPAPRQAQELGSYQKGLARGILNTGAQFMAGGAAVSKLMGAEETAENWMKSYDALTKESEKFKGVQFGEAFDSPGKFVSWAAGLLGEQTPVIASMVVSGGIGSVMGKVAAKGLLPRGAQALSSEQAKKVAKWSLGGAAVSSGTAMTALEGGGIYGEQREAGLEPNPEIALIGGAINGVLETVVPLTLWKVLKAENLAGPFVNDLLKRLGTMGLIPRIAATAGGTAVGEAGTEALQEEVAIQARALLDEKYERLGEEANQRRIESAASGALVGGLLGGAGGSVIPSQPAQGLPADDGLGPLPIPEAGLRRPTPLYNLGESLPPVNLPKTTNNLGLMEGQEQQPQVQGPPIAVPLEEEQVIPETILPAIPPQPPIAVEPKGGEQPEEEPVLPEITRTPLLIEDQSSANQEDAKGVKKVEPTIEDGTTETIEREDESDYPDEYGVYKKDGKIFFNERAKEWSDSGFDGLEDNFVGANIEDLEDILIRSRDSRGVDIKFPDEMLQYYYDHNESLDGYTGPRLDIKRVPTDRVYSALREYGIDYLDMTPIMRPSDIKGVEKTEEKEEPVLPDIQQPEPQQEQQVPEPAQAPTQEQAKEPEKKAEAKILETSHQPPKYYVQQEDGEFLKNPETNKPFFSSREEANQAYIQKNPERPSLLEQQEEPVLPDVQPVQSVQQEQNQPSIEAQKPETQPDIPTPIEAAEQPANPEETDVLSDKNIGQPLPIRLENIIERLQGRDRPPAIILEPNSTPKTKSGRTTTPFPKLSIDSPQMETKSVISANRWLLENAVREAELREGTNSVAARSFRDELNQMQMAKYKRVPPATLDNAKEYVFGDQEPQSTAAEQPAKPPRKSPLSDRSSVLPDIEPEKPVADGHKKNTEAIDREFAEDLKRFGVKTFMDMKGIDVQVKPGSQLSKRWGGKLIGLSITDKNTLNAKTSNSGGEWMPLSEFEPKGKPTNETAEENLLPEVKPQEKPKDIEILPEPDTIKQKPKEEAEDDKSTEQTEPSRSEDQGPPASGPPEDVPKPSGAGDTQRVPSEDQPTGRGNTGRTPGGGSQLRPSVGTGQQGDRVPTQPKPLLADETADQEESVGPEESSVQSGKTPPQHTSPSASTGALDYHIQEQDQLEEGGQKTKYNRNVEAIKTLKQIEAEGRMATADEQATLVRYTGWGGIPQAFDLYHKDWRDEARKLKDLMTDEEWRAARESTQYAHYTSPSVIRGIWSSLQHFGFEHGRILEPGAGIGHFLGLMPKEAVKGSRRTAIEVDDLSGRILKQLYQSSNVNIAPFEDVQLPDNFFDLAIGNVPFSDAKPYGKTDKDLNKKHFSLHDYFFAKALKKTRPGGMIAFLTSRFTMDKVNASIREYIGEQANLVAAVRLPNNAFKGIANTEVVTDLIVLQKREPGEKASGPQWMELADTNLEGPDGKPVKTNIYYKNNPSMILGNQSLAGSMYRDKEYTVESDGRNLQQAIESALKSLPANIMTKHVAPKSTTNQGALESIPAPGDVKNGAYVVQNGILYTKQGEELVPKSDAPSTTVSRIAGMIEVRDALRDVFRTQLEEAPEQEIIQARKKLNKVYDAFVKKHGPINQTGNRRAYQLDPDWPALQALEQWNPRTKEAKKEAIFSKRTIQPQINIEKTETAQEGLLVSLNELGLVSIPKIAVLTGKPVNEVIEELGPLIYENPEGSWEHREEYLSGNVKEKLKAAEAAAKIDPRYQRNVEALKVIQPVDLAPSQISVRLGAGWVPVSDVQQFIKETTDGYRLPQVSYNETIGKWSIGEVMLPEIRGASKLATKRASVQKILEGTLNSQAITIYDEVEDGKRVINEKETFAVKEVQAYWHEQFEKWIWADQKRAERLARKYNDAFNNTVQRTYDGTHLKLPGSNPGITLRDEQKAAIWRILQTGNTLLGHEVGIGKTFALIGAAMESRRLGLASKPIIVVPKHLVGMWRDEFLKLYPSANVLMPSPDDFKKANRKNLVAKIATGDWDAIVVAHSSFSRIPVSKETERAFLQGQINILMDFIKQEEAGAKGDQGKKRTIKELEKMKKRLEAKLKKRMDKETDDGVTFEESGIDMVMVDEADIFKNLFYPTRMTRIAGLANTDSLRASDMYMKTRYLSKLNNGRNVVFATGTPISNTMAEVFTMQRYLQQEKLESMGLEYFDSWARMFGQEVTGLELSPAGKWRKASRFAKFVNLPELMQAFGQVLDVKFAKDVGIKRPNLRTGKPINVTSPASPALVEYVKTLIKRAEALKGEDPRIDNMLKITGDGRHAALDIRLRVPGAPEDKNGKIPKMVGNVIEEYKKSTPYKGTQLVFLDLSTPKSKSSANDKDTEENDTATDETEEGSTDQEIELEEEVQARESVYHQIREKLIKGGIPAKEIAFIHDANTDARKTTLFSQVNAGEIRVLIGSTERMGAGMNVQQRLVASHNVDAPWRPRDLEQRNGRILRQGNILMETVKDFEIAIYNYATEAPSFDVRMWQTLESKAKMIEQVMHYDPSVREIEDVDVQVLSIAEMKAIASGNPIIMEKVTLDHDVQRLRALRRHHEDRLFEVKRQLAMEKSYIPYWEDKQKNLSGGLEILEKNTGDDFSMKIGKEEFTERVKAGEKIMSLAPELIEKFKKSDASINIGAYRGLNLVVMTALKSAYKTSDGQVMYTVQVGLINPEDNKLIANGESNNAKGIIQSLDINIRKVIEEKTEIPVTLENIKKRIQKHEKELNEPFQHEEEYQKKSARLKQIDKEIGMSLADEAQGGDASEPVRDEPKSGDTIKVEEMGSPERDDDQGYDPDEDPDDDGPGGGVDAFGMPAKGSRKYAGSVPRIQPAPITGEKPKALRAILSEASHDLDQKIWRAKVPRGMGGVYIPKSKAVLFKYANDLDTAAHELAHSLDRKFDLLGPIPTRNQFGYELSTFWQHGSVTKSGPRARLAYRQAEGVAEWMRAWLVNPVATEQQAPKFTKWALSRLPDEVKASLKKFGEEIRVFAGSSGLEQIQSNMEQDFPLPGVFDRIKGTKAGPGFQTSWVDRMAQKWTDDLAPFLKGFEYARKQRGESNAPILPKDDPRIMARLFMGMNAEVEDTVKYGVPRANRPHDDRGTDGGVTWLLEPLNHGSIEELEQEKNDVSAYMIAQRTIEKAQQFGRKTHISGIGGGIANDLDVALRTLQELQSDPDKRGRLEEAAKRYRQWADANLQYLVDHGRMSQEQYDDIKANNEYYVAMHRVVEVTPNEEVVVMTPRSAMGRHGKIGAAKSVVKEFKGSDLSIKDPYNTLLDATAQALREADRNHVLRAFVETLDLDANPTTGPDVDLATVGRIAKEGEKHTIPVFRDGKREIWQFHVDVYRALKGFVDGPVKMNKFFTIFPSILRASIVYAPTFAAKNPIRDAFHRAVLSDAHSKPWDSLKLYQPTEISALKRYGGDQAGHYFTDEKQYTRAMKGAMEELAGKPKNLVVMAHKVGKGYMELMQMSERQGRLAEYRRAFNQATTEGVDLGDGRKTVLDEYNAGLWAASKARGLIDYAVAGEYMRWINQIVVFSNAAVQGIRVYAKAAAKNPARLTARTIQWAVIPALIVYALNAASDDLDEFRQLPAYQRDLFYNLKIGPDMWASIPKSFEIGLVASTIERLADYLNGNKQAFEGHVGQFIETMLPVDTAGLTGPLQGVIQAVYNYDVFRQKHIVPIYEERLELDRRKTWRASRIGQVLQEIFGIDARKMDFLMKAQFGYFGQYATKLSDLGRTERQGLGLGETGFIRPSPSSFSQDVQWVDKKAAETGALNLKAYKQFREYVNKYYSAKTPEARDRQAKILRFEAKKMRREWERNPPRKDAEEKLKKKKYEEVGHPDPVLNFFGIK